MPDDLRHLTPADVSQAIELSSAAGWNHTEEDWARVIALQPDLCIGIDSGGRLAATGAAVCYDRDLAWIGMMLTHPECRRRGLARRILEMLVGVLDLHRLECIRLDATDLGHPLYLQFGFVDETPVQRWFLAAAPEITPPVVGPYQPKPELDRTAFGADRSELLQMLASEGAAATGNALAMGRPGRLAAFFGPCTATNEAGARLLLEWFLSRHARQPVYWDILTDKTAAVALAREYGFEPHRKLMRMRRGRSLPFRADYLYAAAGFEYG